MRPIRVTRLGIDAQSGVVGIADPHEVEDELQALARFGIAEQMPFRSALLIGRWIPLISRRSRLKLASV